MKAIIFENYGEPEVLKIRDIPKPNPKGDELLIKIHATTVTAGDWRMRKAEPYTARLFNGLLRPRRVRVLGFECAGEVEAVGESVTEFKTGDSVFAYTGFGFGAYAEYICLSSEGKGGMQPLIALKPKEVSYQKAAALPTGGLAALNLLRKGKIEAEQEVLIIGASGSVGTFAVQLARYFGAHVTGVCSTANLGLVKSLNANEVIDYTKQNLTTHDNQYDLVFDVVGIYSKTKCKHLLKPGGTYIHSGMARKDRAEDLAFLASLVNEDKLKVVINRQYAFDQIVEAHRFVETGHKQGNVVITAFPTSRQGLP